MTVEAIILYPSLENGLTVYMKTAAQIHEYHPQFEDERVDMHVGGSNSLV